MILQVNLSIQITATNKQQQGRFSFAGKVYGFPSFFGMKTEVSSMRVESNSAEIELYTEDRVQDQIDDLILELIRERKKRKITQVELAKQTGIPQVTISRLESFRSSPALQTIVKLSTALGLVLALQPSEQR